MGQLLPFPELGPSAEAETWPPAEAVISMMETYLPLHNSIIDLRQLFRNLPYDVKSEEPVLTVYEGLGSVCDATKQFLKDQDKHLDLAMAVMKQAARDSYLQGIAMGLAAVHRLDRLPPGALEALERSTDPRHQTLLKKVQGL